jgi:dTDP-4-amino-4,6-dideoxygalactose transaminase
MKTTAESKTSVSELAIFGSKPAFDDLVYVGQPTIPNRKELMRRIEGILDRKWLSNAGPCVNELQSRLAEILGVKHCVVMNNGTTALEIVTRAAGLGGEVIVPSFTFIATPHSLQWQQITPVFCDIDPKTHNIDPAAVEKLITPNTTAILAVHLWGRPCDVEALQEIANRHNLKLLFDAAHAFSCSHQGKLIGGFGDAEVFSFHATKFFHTLEGGAVATNDDELARKLMLMKNFGFTGYDRVEHIGRNGKMNEISAAVGLVGLDHLADLTESNRRLHAEYRTRLSGTPGIELVDYNPDEKNNYQYIVVEIDEDVLGLSRDEMLAILHAENVLARRYFYPGCHRMEPYRSYFPNAGLVLPNTEWLAGRVLTLPTGTSVTLQDIRTICGIIKFAADNKVEIKRHTDMQLRLQDPRFGETGVGSETVL